MAGNKSIIMAEKESAAKNMMKAFGGKTGSFEGTPYRVEYLSGHVMEMADPAVMNKKISNSDWSLESLPWYPEDFVWSDVVDPKSRSRLNALKAAAADPEVTEIVIATDDDPSGEGDLLGWEPILHLGLDKKLMISRMRFADETPEAFQKAFRDRERDISAETSGEYLKAVYRSRFDLLSMQWVRMFSTVVKSTGRWATMRNGRLKSAMVQLVGDQLVAHNSYVRKPWFNYRFVDDKGVVYTSKDEERFENKADVPAGKYSTAKVVPGKVNKKSTPPPKLFSLSQLSTVITRKGFSDDKFLATYQSMYQDSVVSYPRTADKFVSVGQFEEMLPNIDAIATVVGIDPGKLTHRSPRKSHVKAGGAHGANRPGKVVPDSLDAVEAKYGRLGREIYDAVARNYLTMLAEDYRYEQRTASLAEYPAFTGSASVPVDAGWKDVFGRERDEVDADVSGDSGENTDGGAGLGTTAEPEIHEGVPPRPAYPTKGWLINQLERRDIGTAASQMSTYAEVKKGSKALLSEVESTGKISMTEIGALDYKLLPGTWIGDLGLTEKVFANMDLICAGELTVDEALAGVPDMIIRDIGVVRENATRLTDEDAPGLKSQVADKETVSGVSSEFGQISINRAWSGHRFTDEEVDDLFAGKEIVIKVTRESGSVDAVKGRLAKQTYKGHVFHGFQKSFNEDTHVKGKFKGKDVVFKRSYGTKKLTDTQIEKLLAGETIKIVSGSTRRAVKLGMHKISGTKKKYFGVGPA